MPVQPRFGIITGMGSITTRRANADDDAEIAAIQAVYERAEWAIRPDAALHTLAELTTGMRRPAKQRCTRWCVAIDPGRCEVDRIVGVGMVVGKLEAYTDEAIIQLWVPPSQAGQGVGRALADHCEGVASKHGRTVLIGDLDLDGPAGERRRRFAETRGYRLALAEIERRCRLPIPEQLLDECTAEARPHHAGYTVEAFTGPIPSQWASGYCAVSNRLDLDAPTGELACEEGRRTPEMLADQDAEIIEQGRTRVSAFGFSPDGEVVGYTTCVAGGEALQVGQRGTLVHPDHRGHRLGLAVKAACYRLLQREFPDREYITTTNADENAWMIAINDRLGFRVHSRIGTFQRRAFEISIV